MILVLKDGRRMAPLRIGMPETEELTDVIKGYDLDSPDRDLFGQRVIEAFGFADIAGTLGSYAFTPYTEVQKTEE